MAHGRSEFRLRAFGAACHICVEDTGAQSDAALSLAKSELSRLESKYSAFSSRSIVGQMNTAAGNSEFIELDKEARSLFEFATALWHQSNHQFDPSSSILQSCYSDNGPVQGAKDLLKQCLPKVDWARIELTDNGARILDSGMLINLDSCVRPYAVDSIRRIFASKGVRSALISLDEDITTIGKQPDGANWLVGVKHPKSNGVAIARLKLNDQGYSIRGDFKKCLKMHNERFGRALSPIDGHPIPGLLCVGVMANTALEACGAANVAQVKTEQQALIWLSKLDLRWFAIDRNLNCHGLLSNNS
jgi:thiamine biosynthesis lipoprotein